MAKDLHWLTSPFAMVVKAQPFRDRVYKPGAFNCWLFVVNFVNFSFPLISNWYKFGKLFILFVGKLVKPQFDSVMYFILGQAFKNEGDLIVLSLVLSAKLTWFSKGIFGLPLGIVLISFPSIFIEFTIAILPLAIASGTDLKELYPKLIVLNLSQPAKVLSSSVLN